MGSDTRKLACYLEYAGREAMLDVRCLVVPKTIVSDYFFLFIGRLPGIGGNADICSDKAVADSSVGYDRNQRSSFRVI